RLVRKVCEACAGPETDMGLLTSVPQEWRTKQFRRGSGCGACRNSGHKGRLGVFEMFRLSPTMQKLIELNATETEICAAACADGMMRMWEDGMEKASRGLTSLAEVIRLRAAHEEREQAETQAKEAA